MELLFAVILIAVITVSIILMYIITVLRISKKRRLMQIITHQEKHNARNLGILLIVFAIAISIGFFVVAITHL